MRRASSPRRPIRESAERAAAGLDFLVDVHVQADPALSLRDAHVLSGCVKGAIRDAVPEAGEVLIHMEPYEPGADAPAERR